MEARTCVLWEQTSPETRETRRVSALRARLGVKDRQQPAGGRSGHAAQRDNWQMLVSALERDNEFEPDAGLARDECLRLGARRSSWPAGA